MTILVRCSDPRINKLLSMPSVSSELGLTDPTYAIIANPGSVKFFLYYNLMDLFMEQLDILVPHFKADRIVLLNHSDCGFYKKIGQNKEEDYFLDLRNVKAEIFKKFPNIKTDGYFIDTNNGDLRKV